MSLTDLDFGFSIPEQFEDQYQNALASADLFTLRSILMTVCNTEDRAKVAALLPDELVSPTGIN